MDAGIGLMVQMIISSAFHNAAVDIQNEWVSGVESADRMRYIFPMSISVVTFVAARPTARSVMPKPAAVIAAANRARRPIGRAAHDAL